MEKNIRLADIYIKIYNKRPLTMEDLTFLAKYDRECFEKTCRNLIYNMPEASELMEPKTQTKAKLQAAPPAQPVAQSGLSREETPEQPLADTKEEPADLPDENKEPEIRVLLENLKKMEWKELPISNVNADHVKNLLGSLYMEMLFPHNDRYRYFKLEDHEEDSKSTFNKRA